MVLQCFDKAHAFFVIIAIKIFSNNTTSNILGLNHPNLGLVVKTLQKYRSSGYYRFEVDETVLRCLRHRNMQRVVILNISRICSEKQF